MPYEVLDPRPFAASTPYTYFLPDLELLRAIGAGDHVKAVIRAVPPSEKYDAERMWIWINSVEVDWLEGELDSEPKDMPSLPRGSTIRLPLLYAIDAIINDPLQLQHCPSSRHESTGTDAWSIKQFSTAI